MYVNGVHSHVSLDKPLPVFLFVSYELEVTHFCHSNLPTQAANAL